MRKFGRTVEVGAIANIENEIPLTIKLGWVKVKAGIIDLNTAKDNFISKQPWTKNKGLFTNYISGLQTDCNENTWNIF